MSVRGSDETQSNPESHQTMIAGVIDFGAEELHEECITQSSHQNTRISTGEWNLWCDDPMVYVKIHIQRCIEFLKPEQLYVEEIWPQTCMDSSDSYKEMCIVRYTLSTASI